MTDDRWVGVLVFSASSLSSFRYCSSCISWGDMYYHPTKREIEIGWAVLLGGGTTRAAQSDQQKTRGII